MQMQTDVLLQAVLAASPILIVLVLILGAKWSAAKAGWVGFGVALVVAWGVFGFGRTLHSELGPVVASGGVMGEALFTAATILWIIVPALCLYQLQLRTGVLYLVPTDNSRTAECGKIVL
jgi:lactate permease